MRPPPELVELARSLADPALDICIEAEGNVSSSAADGTLWIKASGVTMGTAGPEGFALVESEPVIAAVRNEAKLSELDARKLLNEAKADNGPALPSTETYMHACLLERAGGGWVAHGHPTSLLALLVLPDAADFADKRLFPDEIVLCGPATCFVPYVAPGLPLAVEIERCAWTYRDRFGLEPKTYWLQNHGLIVIGKTPRETLSAAKMAVKSARVLLAALQTGRSPRFLSESEVAQIYNWPDEHARQRALWN